MRPELILRRFDQAAYLQIAAELLRLSAENERLAAELEAAKADAARNFSAWMDAEAWAESWRDDALKFQLDLCERDGGEPAIDQNGHLHVVMQHAEGA